MATVLDPESLIGAAASPSQRPRFFTAISDSELAAWEPAWAPLAEAAANPMQSFAWIEAAAATTGATGTLCAIGRMSGEHLTAVAPLVQFPGGFGRP